MYCQYYTVVIFDQHISSESIQYSCPHILQSFYVPGLVPGDGHERGGDMMRQDGYGTHPPPRQKRVRTSFKHHQLRTMKSYFGLNHNPDAKDLKQLAQKTGLSKRVLQVRHTSYVVWKRCKCLYSNHNHSNKI